MGEHTDDLRNVNQGDSIAIHTSEGERLTGNCTEFRVHRAAPETGEIRKQSIWTFDFDGVDGDVHAGILDGLKSRAQDDDFPQYSELWSEAAEESMGYIEEVSIQSLAQEA
jgi:hypothetical protein